MPVTVSNPTDPVSDRLELRLHWLGTGGLVVCSVISLALAAASWSSMTAGEPGGEVIFAASGVLFLVPLAMAIRTRLILTPEGFRVRYLWAGRLVPWDAGGTFYPDIAPRGIYWFPRARWSMPETRRQWLTAMWRTDQQNIPLFGPNRASLLATMNAWLAQYSPAHSESVEKASNHSRSRETAS